MEMGNIQKAKCMKTSVSFRQTRTLCTNKTLTDKKKTWHLHAPYVRPFTQLLHPLQTNCIALNLCNDESFVSGKQNQTCTIYTIISYGLQFLTVCLSACRLTCSIVLPSSFRKFCNLRLLKKRHIAQRK